MEFLYYHYLAMKFGALIPLEKDASVLFKVHFYLFRIINATLITWTIFINVFYYIFVGQSFRELLGLLNCLNIGVWIRMVGFYLNDQTLLKICKKMNLTFKKSTGTGLEETSIVPEIRMSNIASIAMVIICQISGFVFALLPCIMKSVPLPRLWYPYDDNVSPYREMSMVWQFLAEYSMTFHFNTLDAFFIGLTVVTAGQFKILGWEMENACFSSLLSCGFDKETILKFKESLPLSKEITPEGEFYDIYEFMQTTRYFSALQSKMLSLITYHRSALNYCKFIEGFFAPALLVIFLSALTHTALMLYTMSLNVSLTDKIQTILHFISSAFEWFLLAFTSDLMVKESSKLQYSLYATPWYLCPKKVWSTFKYSHFYLHTNVGLSLGGFQRFDIISYGWFLKTSFSYFTVLRNTDNKL